MIFAGTREICTNVKFGKCSMTGSPLLTTESTLKDGFSTTKEECQRLERVLEQSRKSYSDLMTQYVMYRHDRRHPFRYNQEKTRLESDLLSASQQAKMKTFECDRLRVVYEDTLGTVRRLQLENERLQKKLDILTKEFHDLRSENASKLMALENRQFQSSPRKQINGVRVELDESLRISQEVARRKLAEQEVCSGVSPLFSPFIL